MLCPVYLPQKLKSDLISVALRMAYLIIVMTFLKKYGGANYGIKGCGVLKKIN
jgi:hypothetical protein